MKYCTNYICCLREYFLSSNFHSEAGEKLSISCFDSFLFSFFFFQAGRIRAVGIVGIERKLEEKRKETDKNISEVGTLEFQGQSPVWTIYIHSHFLLGPVETVCCFCWEVWIKSVQCTVIYFVNWLFNLCKDPSFKQFLSRRLFFETYSVYLLN